MPICPGSAVRTLPSNYANLTLYCPNFGAHDALPRRREMIKYDGDADVFDRLWRSVAAGCRCRCLGADADGAEAEWIES